MIQVDDDSSNVSDYSRESDDDLEISPETIRLNQIKRKKQVIYNVGKTVEETIHTHVENRMFEGINRVLELHTPCELSSICGILGLPVQQKGRQSIYHIMQYINENSDMKQQKVRKVLTSMWDGVLIAYLKSIGHPSTTMHKDPRETVMNVWLDGGVIVSSNATFVPHFTVRHVKSKYTKPMSADIKEKVDSIRTIQEKVKRLGYIYAYNNIFI